MTSPSGNFPRFLLAICFSSFAMGIHTLLFPWLIVGELGVDPDTAGLAIMLSMLPASFLLLWGGAYSDGRHLGKLLLRLYSLFIIPYLILGACYFWLGWSFKVVLFFGIAFGVVNSFVQPARESLLGGVAKPPLQKSVAKAMIAQSLGLAAGTLAGGVIIQYSLALVIGLQMALFVVTGLMMRSSSPSVVNHGVGAKTSFADIFSGLSYAAKSPLIRNLMLMVAVTGFLGFGFYFVMLPLMTREIYQAEASFLAGLQAAFMLGGVFVSLVVVRWFGTFKNPGRILVMATILRGLLLLIISLRLPTWLIFPGIFIWGVLSSFSAIVGRTMVQEYSPDALRARLISIYQLALFGVGPFGALFGGILIAQFGILITTAALGIFSVIFGVLFIVFKNQLWLVSNAVAKSN